MLWCVPCFGLQQCRRVFRTCEGERKKKDIQGIDIVAKEPSGGPITLFLPLEFSVTFQTESFGNTFVTLDEMLIPDKNGGWAKEPRGTNLGYHGGTTTLCESVHSNCGPALEQISGLTGQEAKHYLWRKTGRKDGEWRDGPSFAVQARRQAAATATRRSFSSLLGGESWQYTCPFAVDVYVKEKRIIIIFLRHSGLPSIDHMKQSNNFLVCANSTMSLAKLSQEALRQRRRRLLQSSLWFAPRQHVWLQCSASPSTPTLQWRVQWGLTKEGMDRLGDITKLKRHVELNDEVRQWQTFLSVEWEGYNWTAADELYHTVWESVEGEEGISSPVSGKVIRIVDSDKTIVDEDVAWAELECQEADLLRDAASWVDEPSYQKWVETLAPSRFSDQVA